MRRRKGAEEEAKEEEKEQEEGGVEEAGQRLRLHRKDLCRSFWCCLLRAG